MKKENSVDTIMDGVKLLTQYLQQRDIQLGEANFILTGSTALHFIGILERVPNDIDMIIVANKDNELHDKLKQAIVDFGRISGIKVKTSSSFKGADDLKTFVSIEFHGIVWDFWITDVIIPVLPIRIPYTEIQIANPNYTWTKKLEDIRLPYRHFEQSEKSSLQRDKQCMCESRNT